jgi:uncharacterized membrane protein
MLRADWSGWEGLWIGGMVVLRTSRYIVPQDTTRSRLYLRALSNAANITTQPLGALRVCSSMEFACSKCYHPVIRTTSVPVTYISFADGDVVNVGYHGDAHLWGRSHLCSVVPACSRVCAVLWLAAAGKVSASRFFHRLTCSILRYVWVTRVMV